MLSLKKFIFTLLIIGILCLSVGYFGSSFFKKDTNISDNTIQKEETVDTAEEYLKIENLVKTYIFSSVKYDWETVKALSGGEYKKTLEETIIPNSKNTEPEKYEFNPRSMNVSLKSVNSNQGIVEVSYIVTKDSTPFQEDLIIYLGKENNQWRILSVERKS